MLVDIQTLLTSLLLFAVTGMLGWLVRQVRDHRREWNERAKDVEAMRGALLGSDGDEWSAPQAGLIDTVDHLCRVVGHNGGSTLFDGQDELKRGQAALLRWAAKHTDESVASDPHTSWTHPHGN